LNSNRFKLRDADHEQAFQLPAVQKWHSRFADRTREIENEARSGRTKKTDLAGPIAELLCEKLVYIVQSDM
jgi:hypothetical protein